MKKVYRLFLTALAAAAAACTVNVIEPETTGVSDEVTQAEEQCYEQGVAVVKFSEEMASLISADLDQGNVVTKSSELNSFVAAYGITSIKRVFSDDERWLERQHREGLHLWYELTFDPDAVVATRAASELKEVPGIEIAEACPKVKPLYYYNDTYYYNQWALNGTYSINVEDVWTTYTKGSSDVIVSVVDGGVDPSHPDLQAHIIPGGSGGSKNFCTGNYSMSADDHGTHVGGIISAVSNNGIGVAGIAGGDYVEGIEGVKLLNSQVFSGSNSASTSGFAEALKYGADNGALISQNSWGYDYDSESQAKSGTTPAVMTTAIDYFAKYAGCDNNGDQLPNSLMQGGVVIFAAGNDGWQYGHPADYETCIAVGATDKYGNRASYSNYGDWVDICAPGSDIYSTYYDGGSSYASLSGTSMACPMVSGVAALVVSYQGGTGFTADQLRECLIEGASSDRVNARNVGPYLDAMGSVTYGVQGPPQGIDSYSVSVSGNTIYFTWNVPAGNEDGTEPAYGMLLCASTSKNSIDNLVPKSPTSDVATAKFLTNSYEVGAEATAALTVDNFSTVYYVTCVPYNYGNQFADIPGTQTVTTGVNNPPTITSNVSLDDLQVRAAQSVSITFTIEDPDNHDVTVSYKSSSIAEKWAKTTDNTYVLTIRGSAMDDAGNYVSAGTYSSTITATDSYGAQTEQKVTYTIVENQAPEVGTELDNVLLTYGDNSFSGRSAEIELNDCFVDPDGDNLSYTVENTSSSTVQAVVNTTMDTFAGDTTYTTKLYLTAFKVGTAQVTIKASDARGLSCSQSIMVAVRADGEAVLCYPNPVVDKLYVSTDATSETSTSVKVTSSTGSTVHESTTQISAFNPGTIDFSGIAPGTYSVRVKYGSVDVTKKVVKK